MRSTIRRSLVHAPAMAWGHSGKSRVSAGSLERCKCRRESPGKTRLTGSTRRILVIGYTGDQSQKAAMSRSKATFTPGTPLPDHWFHILLALADDNRHGLGIIQEVIAQTDGHIQVWPGMLYLALKRMTDDGLVAETDPPAGFVAGGGRPRVFRITPRGRAARE